VILITLINVVHVGLCVNLLYLLALLLLCGFVFMFFYLFSSLATYPYFISFFNVRTFLWIEAMWVVKTIDNSYPTLIGASL
jgi:hypothetical protein